MVYRAKGKPVDYRGNALFFAVLHDVRRLNERRFAEGAYGTAVLVSPEDILTKTLLMESEADFSERVATRIGRGAQALTAHIRSRQSDLEKHGAAPGVVAGHKDWLDNVVLPTCNAAKVDEGCLRLESGSQRSVVGLIDGTGAVAIEDRAAFDVDLVFIGRLLPWYVRRRHQSQSGRAAHLFRPVDAPLKGAEADSLTSKDEPLS
jgi:hypothetical protein